MKKKLSPAAGHSLCLSALLMVGCVAMIAAKAFLPYLILPRITITLLTALSLGALVLEHLLFGSERPDYLETGLLAIVSFGVMTWASGLAHVPGAGRVGIAGGIVYTLCLLVFTAMRAQLESADVKHKRAALVLAAALLLLATQSLAGIPILG